MQINHYIDNINCRFRSGNATEHTFRGDLQQLIESLLPDVRATNEPKRQSCGAPDYILTKKDIPVGYIEAKDIGGHSSELLATTNEVALVAMINIESIRKILFPEFNGVIDIFFMKIIQKTLFKKRVFFTYKGKSNALNGLGAMIWKDLLRSRELEK